MSADEDTVAVTADVLKSLTKGTVIKVIDPAGHTFELVAEARSFRDFVLHHGTPTYLLAGVHAYGGARRVYWSADRLAYWLAEGMCRIELAAPHTKETPQ